MVLSIDPGKNCGGGLFSNGTLVAAKLISVDSPAKHPATWARVAIDVMAAFDPPAGSHLVMEFPKIYPRKKSKAKPDDILCLAAMTGAIAQAAASRGMSISYYRPHEWKGDLNKEQVQERVTERLSRVELAAVHLAGGKSHNIWEGIGIGLKYHNRFEPWRAYRT